ncbi:MULTISPECIES: twin-arginine translocase TatA/TatE family subunit [Staphylococcus]|uniref:twin-arginine translocase TatA/TatE family subunit n=1 Tax=Staphylococcus TaxID=1279 RepID=UPI00019FC097|nr:MULTISPECIES: twin-arginine translocase TatA/TatE family subunit [Staphylococcus]EEK12779.1 twin arginine-targeting protein translocase, TatA/E family [Staphylococcus hominis SK119]EHR86243.1 twin arginine-targeting protein translocase, TatA/E family [Staphylococcus hominis VCU122]MCC3711756.1 twin-arginine translocase TatA/TatE family subunit [Staphylococcus hominis]MCC3714065.1 twin-arginine translocase TatA/TatE family subunit [Staphylococcus hominis]MCI2864841.1 twin-arginine translocas
MFHELFILGIAGPTSLVIISIVALIIFGPKKLPQFGKAIGSTLREFKSAAEHIDSDEVEATPSKHSKQQRDKSN